MNFGLVDHCATHDQCTHDSLSQKNSRSRFLHFVFTARRTIDCKARYYDCTVARRPSVCPSARPYLSVVDQDHVGWKSWKLIARTISPTHSLFVAQRPSTYSQGNVGQFGESIEWGGEKSGALEHKINREYL